MRPPRFHGPLLLLALLCLTSCQSQRSLAQAAPEPPHSYLGINLFDPSDWGTELPFVDLFRCSRRWISQNAQAQPWGGGPQLQRDDNGWITRLDTGCYADTPLCLMDKGHLPEGQYTCLYDGEGKIEFWGAVSRVVDQQPGRLVFETKPGAGQLWLRLRETNPANYVRNIRVLMPGCEQTYREQPFRAGFLKMWQGMNTIRFTNWMRTDYDPLALWSERSTPQYCNWSERGVPVEVMVDLCNRLGANGWFPLPHNADDDYIRQFATVVHDRLKPGLKAYVEYSNEVWNSQFTQNRYAIEQAKRLGLGPAERPWEGGGMYYTHRSLEIFRIWEEVFGGRDRFVRVLAWQAVAPWWVEHIILPTEEAYKHCDAVAIAPYFGPLIPAESRNGQPSAGQVVGWTVDQLLDYVEQTTMPQSLDFIRQQKAITDRYGLRLVCYEAGQHLVGLGAEQNNERLTQLLMQANRHPRMGQIYTKYLDGWKQASPDLMCLFCSVGPWGKYGSFPLAESYDQTEADQPKLKAVMEWMRANPR